MTGVKTNLTDADIGVLVAAAGSGGSLPAGLICMWSGLLANIPGGWLICDGLNGTPDLRDRFIKGAAAGVDPGATGGAASVSYTPAGTISGTAVADHASHTHTYTQVPNHVHVEQLQGSTTGATTGTHLMASTSTGGSLRASGESTANPTGGVATATTNGPSATLTHSVTQGTFTGNAASIPTEPAYFALAFIMKS